MLGLGSGITRVDIAETYTNSSVNTNSMHFDNIVDSLLLSDQDEFSFSGTGDGDDTAFSFSCWVIRDGQSSDGLVCKGTETAGDREWRVFWVGSSMYVDLSDGGVASANYRRAIFPNAHTGWHHITITYSPERRAISRGLRCYINGSDIAASSAGGVDIEGMTPGTGTLLIGRIDNTSYHLGGSICQFVIWKDYIISENEAQYLYNNADKPINVLASSSDYSGHNSVVLWLKLAADAVDFSGNGFNASVVGDAALTSETPF